MGYLIKNQYESADRNHLDRDIREWAAKDLHHLYVDDDYLDYVISDIKSKAAELNAKYPRVQKKLAVDTWNGHKDAVNIRISKCLQYVAYKVVKIYHPTSLTTT